MGGCTAGNQLYAENNERPSCWHAENGVLFFWLSPSGVFQFKKCGRLSLPGTSELEPLFRFWRVINIFPAYITSGGVGGGEGVTRRHLKHTAVLRAGPLLYQISYVTLLSSCTDQSHTNLFKIYRQFLVV